MKKVQIIGAGFSGLTLALELQKKGFAVELFENSDRVGGLIGTRKTQWGLVESAANALMLDANVAELLQDIGVSGLRPLPTAKKRFIFRGRPRKWPLRFFESLSLIKHMAFHFLTRKFFLKPQAFESVFRWGQRNLGRAATQYLLAPGLQGIYAGDAQVLSSKLILGPLFDKNKARYRGMVTGPQGMQDIIDGLEKKILAGGGLIHFNKNFHFERPASIDSGLPIVLATSAPVAAELLSQRAPQLAQSLSNISMAPLMTVTAFWKNSTNHYAGFGCLVPRELGLRTLGILQNTHIFSGRDAYLNETFILGGATDPDVLKLSDDEIKILIQRERRIIFQSGEDELLSVSITRWPVALPQYSVDLERILDQISLPDQLPGGIYLHGNYLGGIGLSKILARSKKLAQEIKAKHG